MLSTFAMGIAFGIVEVAMPAFGEAHGSRAQGGFALSCFALGSLSGVSGSARDLLRAASRCASSWRWPRLRWRSSRRSIAPSIPVMCALMLIAGLPIAPRFASSYGLVDALARAGHDDRGVRAARHCHRRGPVAGHVGRAASRSSSSASPVRSRWLRPASAPRRSWRSCAGRRSRFATRYRDADVEDRRHRARAARSAG